MAWTVFASLLGLLTILIIGQQTKLFIWFGRPNQDHLPDDNTDILPSDLVVTLFIPGYGGNRYSFGSMTRRLTRHFSANKSMVVFVERDGHLTVRGQIAPYRPLVQVVFRSNRARPELQAIWLRDIMAMLKERGVHDTNIVAHSMGSVTTLEYLVRHLSDDLPAVHHVVVMGSPFNDTEVGIDTFPVENHQLTNDGPIFETSTYKELADRVANLPKSIHLLNIAGQLLDTTNDGVVSVDSAFSLRYLVRDLIDVYQEVVVNGRVGRHSQLHENPAVDQTVGEFLWTADEQNQHLS